MAENETARKKSKLGLLLKTAFVVGLLYFLGRKGFISLSATEQALSQWDKMLPAFAVLLVAQALGIMRWQWLLRAQGVRLPWMRTAQLVFIGNFFNVALPGAVSGDFVKAFYVGQEIRGEKARAFGSILFDRVAGLSALALVSAFAFLFGIQAFWDSPMRKALQFFMSVSAFAVLAFYAYLFLVKEHHDPLLQLFRMLARRFPKTKAVLHVYEGTRHYHNHRLTVLRVLGVSVIIHLLVGFACLEFARALGTEGLALLPVYVVVPIGLLITAIPVLPAGVGTGHAAFLYLFNLIGCARGADIFSLYALQVILFGAVGGVVYLRFRSHEPKPVLDATPPVTA